MDEDDNNKKQNVPVVIESKPFHGRRQPPFAYCACSTTHKYVGKTLPAVAFQLSNKEKFQVWQNELLIAETSSTNSLSDVCVVGSKEEIPVVIERTFKIDNSAIDRIVSMIETLDALILTNLHSN